MPVGRGQYGKERIVITMRKPDDEENNMDEEMKQGREWGKKDVMSNRRHSHES